MQTSRFANGLDCGCESFWIIPKVWPRQQEKCSFGFGWILFEMCIRHPLGGVKEAVDIQGWSSEEKSE